MKKIVLLLMALLLSAVSFGQINVSPTTFHNGIKLPNVNVENTDSLATINGNGEIHYVSKDDVNSWILKVDGVNKKELKLGQALDIISGDNVTLSYSNGTVTISAAGKEYTAGSGLTLIGSEFNADFGTTAGTVTEGNDTRVVHGEAAYLWGDHATQGYLTSYTETDPVYSASTAGSITAADVANWNASEPNVQSDWNATSGDAEILNKPRLPFVEITDIDTVIVMGSPMIIERKGYTLSSGKDNVVEIGKNAVDFSNRYPLSFGVSGAIGNGSVAFGTHTIAAGEYSVAMGLGTEVYSSNGFVAGNSNEVYSLYGTAFGVKNIVPEDWGGTFVIGMYNSVNTDLSKIPLFVIGNGYGSSEISRNNVLEVSKNEILANIIMDKSNSLVTKSYTDRNKLKKYTISNLPSTGSIGDQAIVTDATTPTWNTAVTGGGSTTCVVYYDGTNWIAH